MDSSQVLGEYGRLQVEWMDAVAAPLRHALRIERLSTAIVEANRRFVDLQPIDEQTAESLPMSFR